jgi:hypothetical protein
MRQDLAVCYGQEKFPRYTSYPTAPHFSAAIGPNTYAEWLKAIPPHATTSVYLHIPFCRSMCWYCCRHTSVVRPGQSPKRRGDLDAGVVFLIAQETVTAGQFSPVRAAGTGQIAA